MQIQPGDRVRHRMARQFKDDSNPVGYVVRTIEERSVSTISRCVDVRWIKPDGDSSDGSVRHDPDELVVVKE